MHSKGLVDTGPILMQHDHCSICQPSPPTMGFGGAP